MDVVQTQRTMGRSNKTNSRTTAATEMSEGGKGSSPQPEHASTVNGSGHNSNSNASVSSSDFEQQKSSLRRRGPFERFRAAGAMNPLVLASNSNNSDGNSSSDGNRFVRRRANSAPAAPRRRRHRRRILEDHYRVDPEERVVLPGVPQQDPNWWRDCHDFFNLIVLIPVVALNIMNWNWDMILHKPTEISQAWTGDYFHLFFIVTQLYFMVDLLWILFVPSCVKSPATILQHHVAGMIYCLIPYFEPSFRWGMGACMIVEINTWFLIARRVFNKQGFPPWIIDLSFVSIRIKLISVFFYITWISIRCILYPYLLVVFFETYSQFAKAKGTHWNVPVVALPLHAAFCVLNLKWSYDLFTSKIRYWKRLRENGGKYRPDVVQSGL